MDITVSQSDIVGVIQQKNPMGDENSWFVDNGGRFCIDLSLSDTKLSSE